MPPSENPQWIDVRDLLVPVEASERLLDAALEQAAKRLSVPERAFENAQIVRRAVDSRRRQPRFMVTLRATLDPTQAARALAKNQAHGVVQSPQVRFSMDQKNLPRPVVVGAGPAGLFAALTLAEAGWAPILIERGKTVDERGRDVSALYGRGVLDPESNVCFGEGGAGTYSDGKLYTRIGDERVDRIMAALVHLGALPDILVNTRPHLGTDRLVDLLRAIRARLLSLGTTLLTGTRMDDLRIDAGRLKGVVFHDGEVVDAQHAILATGHSARHVWPMLQRHGAALEARPFAMGFRIEHPQTMIDEARYGSVSMREHLPAADYRVTHQSGDRGVYSFCMCPGGVVVATPTEEGALCINGMSHAARSGRFANSAMVVSTTPEDAARAGFFGMFAGVEFQHSVEQKAYRAGGGAFVAPAARVSDFMEGRISTSLPKTSYRRGVAAAPLHQLYPENMIAALREALRRFDGQISGFCSSEGLLIGVETRTASPIRVLRDASGQCATIGGLYPAGEGMGYGGGIVSAAVDGMRTAEALLENVGARKFELKPGEQRF